MCILLLGQMVRSSFRNRLDVFVSFQVSGTNGVGERMAKGADKADRSE